jgi:hypothetical protein
MITWLTVIGPPPPGFVEVLILMGLKLFGMNTCRSVDSKGVAGYFIGRSGGDEFDVKA